MKLTRKTFLCTDIQMEKIAILKKKVGVKTDTGIWDMALDNFYNSTFKYGTDPMMGGGGISTTDDAINNQAERKVKLEIAKKKVEEDIKLKPKIERCLVDLKGEVVTNPDGSKMCKWQTHDVRGSYDQMIPMYQCGEYLLDNLFMPSKEAVLRTRTDLWDKFDYRK